MPRLVIHGAQLRCSMGVAPASLSVTRASLQDEAQPIATVKDNAPMSNVPSFAMCRAPANPDVARATAAASGVLTPQPCTPALDACWSPGASIVSTQGDALLTDDSTCACRWGGSIEIVRAGSSVEVGTS
jgi:hypothetical protein